LKAEAGVKKTIRSTLQRKTNQFIKELNAQQAEDDGEENSKIVNERLLKKTLIQRSRERKSRKDRKKQAKAIKLQKTMSSNTGFTIVRTKT
jgi:hypothetical protein